MGLRLTEPAIEEKDAARLGRDGNRASGLTLTDKGQSLLTRILPLMTKRREHLTGSLAVIELDVLFDALDKLDISAEADEFP